MFAHPSAAVDALQASTRTIGAEPPGRCGCGPAVPGHQKPSQQHRSQWWRRRGPPLLLSLQRCRLGPLNHSGGITISSDSFARGLVPTPLSSSDRASRPQRRDGRCEPRQWRQPFSWAQQPSLSRPAAALRGCLCHIPSGAELLSRRQYQLNRLCCRCGGRFRFDGPGTRKIGSRCGTSTHPSSRTRCASPTGTLQRHGAAAFKKRGRGGSLLVLQLGGCSCAACGR